MAFHVMLIPTLGCPSNCSYCWSSDERSPLMDIEVIEEVVKWLKNFRREPVTFTFHGGEPLLAGYDFYRKALPMLTEGLSHLKPALALQTNLWNLTDDMAELFHEYNIPIGSSIDGPQELNDLQRGAGYFEKTMRGYEIAKAHNLRVSFISTITSYSVDHREDIFNFFLKKGLNLKIHPALPSLRDDRPEKWAISPEQYGELLIYLLDKYLENINDITVMNIDNLCKSVFLRRGTVCTYVDCMGDTFAVGPDGNIYPCYRFVGMPEYVMGNVRDHPTVEELAESAPARLLEDYREYVDEECSQCEYIKFCRGGCPYNAITPNKGEIKGLDPHCTAYKMIFKEITERANKEFSSAPNMGMLFAKPKENPGIMSLMLKRS